MKRIWVLISSVALLTVAVLTGCASDPDQSKTQDGNNDTTLARKKLDSPGTDFSFLFGGGNRQNARPEYADFDAQYREYLEWKQWQEFKRYQKWKQEQGGTEAAAPANGATNTN